MKMFRVFISIALLSLAACAGTAERATRHDLSGDWIFEVPTGRNVAHGAMTLVAEGDGYGGTLTTDQGDEVLPVRSLELRGSGMRLVVGSPNGDVVFEGALADSGATFDGIVTYHNGQRFPMSGRRKPLR